MENSYQDPQNAKKYLQFLDSPNGQLQQKFLWEAIVSFLPKDSNAKILDAACGNGWLIKRLSERFSSAYGCDISENLIACAQKHLPQANFAICDITKNLPYQEDFFETAILNMAAPDIKDLPAAFKNLYIIIKPPGQLILTIPNPYYTYPVAEWKRSLIDVVLGRKPTLKFKKPYRAYKNIKREFNGFQINSNFYTLTDYLSAAHAAKLRLSNFREITANQDSFQFNLQHQLYRYPLLLLMEFTKH